MAEANKPTFEDRCIISCGMLHPEMTHLAESGFLSLENTLHALDLCLAGLEFFDFGDHNASPWALMDLT